MDSMSASFDTTLGGWEYRLTRDGGEPMPRMSKIELFAAIRRDLAAGMSGRAIEEKYRVGRRTVRAAMVSALPPPRKAMPPRGSKLDPFKPAIDEILRARSRRTPQAAAHREADLSPAALRARHG